MISVTITNNWMGIVKLDNYDKVKKWLWNPRVIGNKVKKVDLFYVIQSKYAVVELVKSEIEYCKEKQISIIIKNKNIKHVKYIGFLNSLCIKYSNIEFYQ